MRLTNTFFLVFFMYRSGVALLFYLSGLVLIYLDELYLQNILLMGIRLSRLIVLP
jgi:hypothetical protein